METFELVCEFDVVRRMGWSDEELGDHIDAVFERLHQADVVREIEATADLDSGRTTVTVTTRKVGIATTEDEPRHVACAVLGVAIRSCGGVHVGLLSVGEEGTLRFEGGRWSGLRTPTWNVRQQDFSERSPDDGNGTLPP